MRRAEDEINGFYGLSWNESEGGPNKRGNVAVGFEPIPVTEQLTGTVSRTCIFMQCALRPLPYRINSKSFRLSPRKLSVRSKTYQVCEPFAV